MRKKDVAVMSYECSRVGEAAGGWLGSLCPCLSPRAPFTDSARPLPAFLVPVLPPAPRLNSGPSRLSDEDISDWDTSLCSSLLLGHLFCGTLCLPSYFFPRAVLSGTGPSPPLMPRPRLLSAGPLADIISFAVVLPPRETLLRVQKTEAAPGKVRMKRGLGPRCKSYSCGLSTCCTAFLCTASCQVQRVLSNPS